MPLLILLAFILVPVTEIAVFIQVGGEIGLGWTLVLVLLTAFAGTALLRHQGLATLARAQQSLEAQEFPGDAIFDGLCLLVAGALLLTPGFVTDALGLLLFAPPFRVFLRRFAFRHLMESGRIHMTATDPFGPAGPEQPRRDPDVIEGEWEVVEEEEHERQPPRDS